MGFSNTRQNQKKKRNIVQVSTGSYYLQAQEQVSGGGRLVIRDLTSELLSVELSWEAMIAFSKKMLSLADEQMGTDGWTLSVNEFSTETTMRVKRWKVHVRLRSYGGWWRGQWWVGSQKESFNFPRAWRVGELDDMKRWVRLVLPNYVLQELE